MTRPGDVEFAAVGIFRLVFGEPGFLRSGIDCGEPVGGRLVRAEDAEGIHVAAHDFGKKVREHVGGWSVSRARRFHLDGIVAKVRQIELFAQQAAIRVRVGGDAARARTAQVPAVPE